MSSDQSQPVRLCCVIGALTTGGSERQMLGILQQLDRARFQPHLFTFYRDSPLVDEIPDDVPHYCYEEQQGALRPGWLPGRIQRLLARSLADYCRREKIDVVYDRTYHVSLVTGAACRRSGVPYINTVVENPQVGFFSTAGPFGRLKYYQLKSVYRRAARVLCVSHGLVRGTADFFQMPESSFSCCYNFVDSKRLAALDAAAQYRRSASPQPTSNLGSSTRPLQMVAVGRLHWQKGLEVILKAIALAKQQQGVYSRLTLVGDGPEREKLQAQVQQLELASDVDFLGWQNDPAPFVGQADLFVLPSLTEGLPNSLLEALLIGTPALASDCDYGPAELTDNGRWATLLPPGDKHAWCEAIRNFAADPTTAEQRAREAREMLLTRFGPETGCRRLEEFLSLK
ncbi:MAG: glycosyltransferase [Planctomycetaceae bacterium]|nr:glycosyltransferase [Planctomycetaceae bacterium]